MAFALFINQPAKYWISTTENINAYFQMTANGFICRFRSFFRKIASITSPWQHNHVLCSVPSFTVKCMHCFEIAYVLWCLFLLFLFPKKKKKRGQNAAQTDKTSTNGLLTKTVAFVPGIDDANKELPFVAATNTQLVSFYKATHKRMNSSEWDEECKIIKKKTHEPPLSLRPITILLYPFCHRMTFYSCCWHDETRAYFIVSFSLYATHLERASHSLYMPCAMVRDSSVWHWFSC